MNLPDDVLFELRYEIARANLEYDDNHRGYRVKDKLHFNDFLEKQRRGCCGEFEITVLDSNGDKWVVGCNHGH